MAGLEAGTMLAFPKVYVTLTTVDMSLGLGNKIFHPKRSKNTLLSIVMTVGTHTT